MGVNLKAKLNLLKRASFGFVAMVVASTATTASAETIEVRGVYAPRYELPSDVQLILIESFQGDLGQDVELVLSNALSEVYIRGEPYFDLFNRETQRSSRVKVEGVDGTIQYRSQAADAILRGSVRSEIIERDVDPKKKRECARRDDDGDCVERREILIECSELTVRVSPRIALVATGGHQLYSHSSPLVESTRFCADDHSVPSGLAMENEMVEELVEVVRRDLAPVESVRDIRVMESRRNLRREDRDAFRAAVRATQVDLNAACDGFLAIESNNPEQVSVLFNIGLCFESSADLNSAAEYYERALAIDPGRDYPTQGISRVISRQRAEADLAQRAQN